MKEVDLKTFEKTTDFLKMKEGQNYIRLLTNPFRGLFHESNMASIFKSIECEGASCSICSKSQYPPALKYIWIALDRISHKVGVLKTGKGLGEKICLLGKENDLFVKDLKIDRVGTRKENTKYSVSILSEDKPIGEEDKDKINELKPILLKKYIL